MTKEDQKRLDKWYDEKMKEYIKLDYERPKTRANDERLKLLKVLLTKLSLVADDV